MRSRTAEWILECEVCHQPELPDVRAGDRSQLERRRIFFGRMPHVIQLDIAAELHRPLECLRNSEMNLRARSGIFVVAVGQLRSGEILPDLEPSQDSVSGVERLVYL